MYSLEPIKVIQLIRESFIGSEKVYTQGSCYQLYLILKYIFPEAEAYYNCDHIITKIKNVYYDINGIVDNISNYLPIDEIYVKDIRKEAINWKFNLFSEKK